MKISAIIDGNVVSGTILLDSLEPLTIKLKHKYNDAGVVKYLILTTVNCQPKNEVFDFSFLNPYYYESLYVEVNGETQQVMESAQEEDDFEVENPLNDYVFTTNDIPEVTEVMVKEEVLYNDVQEYEAFSHLPAPNLIEMEDLSLNGYFVYDEEGGFRFDVNHISRTVNTEVFELGNSPEITVAIKGTEPSRCRLILINSRGEERVVPLTDMYLLSGNHCFSASVVSSTREARVEIDYDTSFEGTKRVHIESMYVGRTAQYFEAEDMSVREIIEDNVTIHPITCFIFDFERLSPFGLRNLLKIADGSNGLRIQFSNSKVRVSKIVDDGASQVIMSPTVSNTKQIGVVITDFDLKIYSDGEEIKTVAFSSPLTPGTYPAEIGAVETEPEYDCNTTLRLSISNKNSFE